MLAPRKILIVDDEPDTVIGLQALFEDAGYETVCAYDGGEGYEKAKSDKPDLITLDCAMEKVSGIKAYKLLNQDSETTECHLMRLVSPERAERAGGGASPQL